MKSNRKLKISRHYRYKKSNPFFPDTIAPKLTLQGDWLKEAGFSSGQSVTVEILDKMLVITVK
jgi:Toxin SymE, type I toxin-antitoxin system